MSDNYTLADIRQWFAGAVDDYRCDTGLSMEEAEAVFDATLADHDREVADRAAFKMLTQLIRESGGAPVGIHELLALRDKIKEG